MNSLKSVKVYAHGCRDVTLEEYRKDNLGETEIIKREIDLIQKYLIEDQNVSTELRAIIIFGNSVTLEYTYPTWSRKIDAERLKSNLEKNSSKIRSFKLLSQTMKISFRIRNDEESIQKDYRQLLDYSTECRSKTDAVLGFVERSNMQHLRYVDLTKYSPIMISGYAGSGKTEMIISMLDSLMKRSESRDLQFALIDQDVDKIIDRLDLKESDYIRKFASTDLRDRGTIHDILAAVVEEIDRRKILHERFDKVVTYKGVIDQWCQIIVVIDDFELFRYSRYELMSLIRKIAEADPSLNVRLIMTTHDGRLVEFIGTLTVKEYFKQRYDLNVNTLVRVDIDQSSSKSRRIADLFSNDGFRKISVETIKLSKEN